MSTKKITVWNSGGQQGKVIETSAVNWEALQRDLSNSGISYSGMKAVIGKTKVNLEHAQAVLPDEDFTLFLFPEKTRSGLTATQIEGLPYAELRATLKDLATKDGSKFTDHFNKDKNYTNKTTAELKSLLISYSGAKGATKSAPASTAVAKAKPAAKELPTKGSRTAPTSSAPARVERKAVEAPKAEAISNIVESLKTDEQKIDFMVGLVKGLSKPSEYAKEQAIMALAELKATGQVKGKGVPTIDPASLSREAEQIKRGLSGVK